MSNLNSKFQEIAGLPPHARSALRKDIEPKSGVTLYEGNIVAIEDQSGTAVIDVHTSAAVSGGQPPDVPWVVIRGNDQTDAAASNTCTCVKMGTGVIVEVETSESFTIADLCRADAGVIKPLTGADEQAVGQVVGVNSSNGTVTIAA